ncbi:MAG TPA: hypothetical protein PLB32_20735 [Acidobacteriota bacterium]|nr:hypothetical protein [Acidobacteriota bacterium]
MATNWLDSIPLEKQEWAIRLTAHLTQLGAIEAGYDPKQLVVDELFEPAGEIARFLFLRRIKQAVDVWNTSWMNSVGGQTTSRSSPNGLNWELTLGKFSTWLKSLH